MAPMQFDPISRLLRLDPRHPAFFTDPYRTYAKLHASPGPLSPAEDAVYFYVTTIARGYLGESVWTR